MDKNFKTEQEAFWAGDFGSSYCQRNDGQQFVADNMAFFAKILQGTRGVQSVLEFGANIGLNLRALRQLLPTASCSAIEINPDAAAVLSRNPEIAEVFPLSILDFQPARQYDLCFTKGVLIHLAPEYLPQVYDLMYQSSRRYLCVAEYYNPAPVEVTYRGHQGRLFKRDFAGEMLDRFPGLKLVDYGFTYHRDPNFPQDDLTWFLLEKP